MATVIPEVRIKAALALAAGIVCIGFSAIFVKLAAVPGPISAFYRVLVAALVVVPWWLVRTRQLPAPEDLRLIVAGGVFFSIDLAMWNTSILLTSAATATLLANNAPLWVGLASWVLFKERLSRRYWLGLALGLAGMAWLMGGDAYRQLRLDTGNLLAVGASVFYAAYLLANHRARSRVKLSSIIGRTLPEQKVHSPAGRGDDKNAKQKPLQDGGCAAHRAFTPPDSPRVPRTESRRFPHRGSGTERDGPHGR